MDSVYEGEKRMSKMTLDDAIIRAKELSESQSVCEDCREEHKQLAEWLEEETCTNKLEYDSRDVFKCSNCGFISVHQTGVKSDEDNRVEFFYSYKPKYCPNCGRKIIG